MKHLFILLFLSALSLSPLRGADPTPAPSPEGNISFSPKLQLKDQERVVLERYIGHAVKYAEAMTPEKEAQRCAESPETFAWQEFPYLNCLLDAHELTGSTKYLDLFKNTFVLFTNLLKKADDGYLGWQGKPIPPRRLADNPDLQIDELQMNFRAITILSRWVELARRNADYAKTNAETISQYLDLMEKQLFPKWDSRGFYVDLKTGGAVYRGLDYPLCNPKSPGPSLSHEKCSILVDGLLGLYRVTNNSLYMRRAVQLATRYKHCLSLKEGQPLEPTNNTPSHLRRCEGHYEWMSWEPTGAWDVNPDKSDSWRIPWIAPDPLAEWYAAALSIAINLYQHGLVFDDGDMMRFIMTQKTRCWNGDFENPQYRTVGGVSSAENKYVQGRFLSYPLSLYDADLSRLAFDGPHEAEVLAQSISPWKGCVALAAYVRSKYLLRPIMKGNNQPFAAFGKAFLDNPENRAFYEKLAFKVTPPGCVTPMKPSQMFPEKEKESQQKQ